MKMSRERGRNFDIFNPAKCTHSILQGSKLHQIWFWCQNKRNFRDSHDVIWEIRASRKLTLGSTHNTSPEEAILYLDQGNSKYVCQLNCLFEHGNTFGLIFFCSPCKRSGHHMTLEENVPFLVPSTARFQPKFFSLIFTERNHKYVENPITLILILFLD